MNISAADLGGFAHLRGSRLLDVAANGETPGIPLGWIAIRDFGEGEALRRQGQNFRLQVGAHWATRAITSLMGGELQGKYGTCEFFTQRFGSDACVPCRSGNWIHPKRRLHLTRHLAHLEAARDTVETFFMPEGLPQKAIRTCD